MSAKNVEQPNAEFGKVGVVLIQHWASMVDDLQLARNQAIDSASKAQEQVDRLIKDRRVLVNALDDLNLDLNNQRNLNGSLIGLIQRMIWQLQTDDMREYFVSDYNTIINEFNREYPVDLLADTELDESDEEGVRTIHTLTRARE